MSSFGRWFNLPRKRSNSTPTRQVLSEFLNRSATESFVPPQHQQYSYHHISSASAAATGYSSLPTTSTTAKPSNAFSAAQRAPLLITSSFYDLAYPFEPCDSPEDETPPEVVIGGAEDMFSNSRPPTPSSTTDVKPQQNHKLNSNHKNKQQQMTHYIQPPPSPQPLSDTAHYYMPIQRDYEQDEALSYYPRETTHPLTWHSKSSPKNIPLNKGGHPSIKRRPTPFADQKSGYRSYDDDEEGKDDLVFEKTQCEGIKDSSTSAMDDHQINYTIPGKTFNSDVYDAEVRKLRSEIKRMEKKHKKHERNMLDAQQQLEYLIISRSYDSSFLSGSSAPQYTQNEQWEPTPSSKADAQHHYYSQSFNEQHNRPSHWYSAYDTDYYYSMHTPNNSYSTNTASFRHVPSSNKSNEPYDYAHVPQKSNEAIPSASHRLDMNDSNNHYFYGYRPSSYASSNTVDDESYYYQLQKRQHQLLSYGRYHGYTPSSSRKSKKRWTQ
ncbi:unnamed protein product [Mucor fragilis]